MIWFEMGSRWHVRVPSDPEFFNGWCGISVIGEPDVVDVELYPDNPCHTCRLGLAMADAEEESLEDAKRRGVIPVPFAPPDEIVST
jgi:hypothetical protein